MQALAIAKELEPEAATERKVVIDGLMEPLHRTPPGQGRVSVRSDWRSTLA